MHQTIKFIIFAIIITLANNVQAQQMLVLEKWGAPKNYKYQLEDDIVIQTKKGNFTIQGVITQINDTSIVINSFTEIALSNISTVVRPRRFLQAMSKLFFIRGGIAYFGIVGINRTINHEYPIIDESTWIISGAMIATGLALRPLYTKNHKLGEKWKLKVLDFEKFDGADGW